MTVKQLNQLLSTWSGQPVTLQDVGRGTSNAAFASGPISLAHPYLKTLLNLGAVYSRPNDFLRAASSLMLLSHELGHRFGRNQSAGTPNASGGYDMSNEVRRRNEQFADIYALNHAAKIGQILGLTPAQSKAIVRWARKQPLLSDTGYRQFVQWGEGEG